MKFLVFTVVLCALVAMGTTQTKSPKSRAMQNGLGSLLTLVRDLTSATNNVISDVDVQAAMKNATAIITNIKSLYTVFGTTNTGDLTAAQRNKLNTAVTSFNNTLTSLQSGLGQFPISAANLSNQLKAAQNAFLNLGGAVVPL